MNLHEVNTRLKNHKLTCAQLIALKPMFYALERDHDTFFKIVDSVDLETLLRKADYYSYACKVIEDKMKLSRIKEIKLKLRAKRDIINKLSVDILALEKELNSM